jgi:hypothetical protein
MKIKIFIIKILSLFLSASMHAQYSEVGVYGGGSHFVGDVGNYGLYVPQGYSFGGFYRYVLNDRWSFRLQVNYGKIANADSLSNFEYRKNRNLNFTSTILEGSVMAEFNFLKYKPGTRHDHTPYLMGGFGVFRFNPKTTFQGQEYELQPLGTEGQGIGGNSQKYALGSSFFVFGMGYKFSVNKFTTIGIESTARRTRTDYLDDVSGFYADPDDVAAANGSVAGALSDRSRIASDKEDLLRGNPDNIDWYIFTGITLQFKFGELVEKCAYFLGK